MGISIKKLAKGASKIVKKIKKPLAVGAATMVGGPAAGALVAKGFAMAETTKKVAQAFKGAPVTGIIPQASPVRALAPETAPAVPPGYFVISQAEIREAMNRAASAAVAGTYR